MTYAGCHQTRFSSDEISQMRGRVRLPLWIESARSDGPQLWETRIRCLYRQNHSRPLQAPPKPASIWDKITELAAYTRSALGDQRLEWIHSLPMTIQAESLTIVHASPNDCWRAPGPQATDDELLRVYGELGTATVVFGHTHQPLIRHLNTVPSTLVNAGSVGLPYDGDTRASYAILEDGEPTIIRVAYDVEHEVELLSKSGSPCAEWTAKMLRSGTPQMP